MNCKQGDLAIVLHGPENCGKIVRCLEFVGELPVAPGSHFNDIWRIDADLHWTLSGWGPYASDSLIRPLLDNDGQDETLTWVPIKTKEPA